MNEAAHATLQAQIDRMRALPEKLRKQGPDLILKELQSSLKQTIAAGQAPDGTPWQATKAGGVPLTRAYKALTFLRAGSGILIKLTGPEALHHLGRAKGEIVRRVIPVGELPPRVAARVSAALVKLCEKSING